MRFAKRGAIGFFIISCFAQSVWAQEIPIIRVAKNSRSVSIVGSIHHGSTKPDLQVKLKDLIKTSHGVCFEHDPNDLSKARAVTEFISFNQGSDSLSKRLGKDLYRQVREKLSEIVPSNDALELLSPLTVINVLPQTIPELKRFYDAQAVENSIDAAIEANARLQNKPVLGFEDMDLLAKSMTQLTDKEWQVYIHRMLAGLNCPRCRKLLTVHSQKAMKSSPDPEHAFFNLNQSLAWSPEIQKMNFRIQFEHRNKHFADAIEKIGVAQKKCDIFVMGAGHLGGPYSVLQQLKSRGYILTSYQPGNK